MCYSCKCLTARCRAPRFPPAQLPPNCRALRPPCTLPPRTTRRSCVASRPSPTLPAACKPHLRSTTGRAAGSRLWLRHAGPVGTGVMARRHESPQVSYAACAGSPPHLQFMANVAASSVARRRADAMRVATANLRIWRRLQACSALGRVGRAPLAGPGGLPSMLRASPSPLPGGQAQPGRQPRRTRARLWAQPRAAGGAGAGQGAGQDGGRRHEGRRWRAVRGRESCRGGGGRCRSCRPGAPGAGACGRGGQ